MVTASHVVPSDPNTESPTKETAAYPPGVITLPQPDVVSVLDQLALLVLLVGRALLPQPHTIGVFCELSTLDGRFLAASPQPHVIGILFQLGSFTLLPKPHVVRVFLELSPRSDLSSLGLWSVLRPNSRAVNLLGWPAGEALAIASRGTAMTNCLKSILDDRECLDWNGGGA